MDAQRHEVFAAIPGEIDATSGSPEDVLAAWLSETDLRGIEFHGDGAVRYADRIHHVLGEYVRVAAGVPPLAASGVNTSSRKRSAGPYLTSRAIFTPANGSCLWSGA
jgi:hypothetical protein